VKETSKLDAKKKAEEALQTYSPHFMEFFTKGVEKKVTLTVGSRTLAHKLRKRLHVFRKLLQVSEHPAYTSAATIKITMKQDLHEPDKYYLSTEKRDNEFDNIFEEAGIKGMEIGPDHGDFESELFMEDKDG
jgi:hypothetical protein